MSAAPLSSRFPKPVSSGRRCTIRSCLFPILIGLVACKGTTTDDTTGDTDGDEPTEEVFDLGPIQSYLRVSPDDITPEGPLIVELPSRGIAAGDVIVLMVEGTYLDDATLDTSDHSIAVFASSDTLLDSSNPHRVPDAIDAGIDYETDPTYNGDLPTDIPEDFRLDGGTGVDEMIEVSVEVPTGATHLLIAASDSFYSDNSSSEEGFRVRLTY